MEILWQYECVIYLYYVT